jgi:hypothetical protein
MENSMKKKLLFAPIALAFVMPFCAPQVVNANPGGGTTGYVCGTGWSPLDGTGDYGVLYAYVYSQPHCGGVNVGFAYFCTVNATDATKCVLTPPAGFKNVLLDEPRAAALAAALRQAAQTSQKISLFTTNIGTANIGGLWVEYTVP